MRTRSEWMDMGIVWVSGGVDSYGHVIGHPYTEDADSSHGHGAEHTPEEASVSSWRWSVNNQTFLNHFIPPKRILTDDEYVKVQDWLVKNGYADDESF